MTTAPAARMRATCRLSVRAGERGDSGEPMEVGRPAAWLRSFTASGKPCIQPRRSPRASSASRSSASASSWAGSRRETMALKRGLSASMRASDACITSRQDTSRAAILRESSVALSSGRSSKGMAHAGKGGGAQYGAALA
ncbi:hypothetical protein D3C85_581520 [compost metagenome]